MLAGTNEFEVFSVMYFMFCISLGKRNRPYNSFSSNFCNTCNLRWNKIVKITDSWTFWFTLVWRENCCWADTLIDYKFCWRIAKNGDSILSLLCKKNNKSGDVTHDIMPYIQTLKGSGAPNIPFLTASGSKNYQSKELKLNRPVQKRFGWPCALNFFKDEKI